MQGKNKTKHMAVQLVFAAAIVIYAISVNSCANPGVGPTGGPRDTIPPVIINSSPHHLQTNFKGNEIIINFDEYIVADNVAANLVVSPPIAERPNVRVRGRNLIVRFEEDLIPGRTYSVDFQNHIKDFNEGNEIESLRMLFSTYDEIDTLRISGYLLDAFTLEPVPDAMATLYSLHHDTIFTSLRPDFIARADKEGFFMFDNLPEDDFRLFGLVDSDRKLYFSKENEKISYTDTLIRPSAFFIAQPDTLIEENDTIISGGYTQFYPEPVYALLFEHKFYKQSITYSRREQADFLVFTFAEPLTDSCSISLLAYEGDNWSYKEFNKQRDSISVWITDSLISVIDTLQFSVRYTAIDSLDNFITRTDTLNLAYTPRAASARSRSRDTESDTPKPKVFDLQTNLTSGNFDLYKRPHITAPSPLDRVHADMITLEIAVNDSTYDAIDFTANFAENSKRRIEIDFEMKSVTSYKLTVDSAAMRTLTGYVNNDFSQKFKTQNSEHYGVITLDISGIDTTMLIQLLKDNKEEDLVKELMLLPGKTQAQFDYLSPAKYRVKAIADYNNNGKWDTGNYEKNIQPEPVYYYPKVFEVKSNWEIKENWEIEPGVIIPKQFQQQKSD